jgi:hypothetical protein
MHSRILGASLAAAAAALMVLTVPAAARASVAVDGGAFISKGSTALGGSVSLGLFSVPVAPVTTELTFAVAGNGAGSAGTVDVRTHLAATTVGAGIGVGNIGATASTSVLYDALVAQSIAPHTALEGRLYFGPQRQSTLFAGLRLSI